ncbi:MAG: glycosyltransferase family 1 protein [Acidobacteria bacterium]|nr:glycosyltransferase family 1 protein [Acidobacteriota bacterium]
MNTEKQLNIAILGTRGIPNRYGGFEACAEQVSWRMAARGHDVTVYSPDDSPYREDVWRGVRIQRVFCKESHLGIVGTFLFDYLCLRDAYKRNFDVILELGYVPSAFFFRLKKKPVTAVLVTNMDGMEWQRAKWNWMIKPFVRKCERSGVKYSDAMVADNPGIRDYLRVRYGKESALIPYGAKIPEKISDGALSEFGLNPFNYYMVVARLEPENNIEMVLDGAVEAAAGIPFLVVGNHRTKYGIRLKRRYENENVIRFLGGIYNYEKLTELRRHCRLYFHGHSVGGTNPSLLEAMASGARICAHDNPFNRAVLEDGGEYFSSSAQVARLIESYPDTNNEFWGKRAHSNRKKLKEMYNWDRVTTQYLELFETLLQEHG